MIFMDADFDIVDVYHYRRKPEFVIFSDTSFTCRAPWGGGGSQDLCRECIRNVTLYLY